MQIQSVKVLPICQNLGVSVARRMVSISGIEPLLRMAQKKLTRETSRLPLVFSHLYNANCLAVMTLFKLVTWHKNTDTGI